MDIVQVLNELKIFVEKLQHLTHYNVQMNNTLFGFFQISYDRIDHFDIADYISAFEGLNSFEIELSIDYEGFPDDSQILRISHVGVTSTITDNSFDNCDLEDLRE